MSASYVESDQADATTLAFYDRAEDRFQALLNILKVFGHHPEYGKVFNDLVMAILKDGELTWLTKELLILKATQRNACQYCVVQHERVSEMLGMDDTKIADIEGDRYKTSPHFTEGEKARLDFTVQIGEDANRVSRELCDHLNRHWSEPQIVEAAFVITTYIMVSKFGDALGVELAAMFDDVKPILTVDH